MAVDSISGKRDWVYLHDSLLGNAENPGAQGIDPDSAADAEQHDTEAVDLTHEEFLAKRREYRANRTEFQKERDKQRLHDAYQNRTEEQRRLEKERKRRYYIAHRDEIIARNAEYAKTHKAQIKARSYERYKKTL